MHPNLRLFIECFLHVLDRAEEPPHRSGLRDFQLEHRNAEASVHQLAGLALHHFCVSDGRFNGCLVGVGAAVRFMTMATGTAPTQQALRDLRAILDSQPTVESLISWARNAFP